MQPDSAALAALSPEQARLMIRQGEWQKPTAGLCAGYTQANLAILPKEWAFDFLLFCQRNPKPCPLLDVTDAGSAIPVITSYSIHYTKLYELASTLPMAALSVSTSSALPFFTARPTTNG